MKPFIYKIAIFLSFISYSIVSQSKELVLKKNFNINENTELHLDFDNVAVHFKESKDQKVHIDYFIEFKNNSEELKYKVFKGVNAKASKYSNIIKLDVKNSMLLGELYRMEVDATNFSKLMMDFFKKIKKKEFLHKSKETLLEEINFSKGSEITDYMNKIKKENPNKNFGISSSKFEQQFVVSFPKSVKIKIKALHSKIDFNFNINQPLKIDAFKTHFKFKKILAKENRINCSNGIFQAEKLVNAKVEFIDMSKVVIGEVDTVEFNTETSKIELGEVGKSVVVNDFNSKIFSYNFSDNFGNFNFKGEYSKLYFYDVKKAYFSMDVFGHNTALNLKEIKTTFEISKEKKLHKILEKKVGEGKVSKGNITIELINGILNLK